MQGYFICIGLTTVLQKIVVLVVGNLFLLLFNSSQIDITSNALTVFVGKSDQTLWNNKASSKTRPIQQENYQQNCKVVKMHGIIVWYCIRVVKNITENNKTSSKTRLIWQENNQQILQLVEIYVWSVFMFYDFKEEEMKIIVFWMSPNTQWILMCISP